MQDLIDRVAPEWRIQFQQFVETGEAQEAFLNYLNQDTAAQDAVEQAFNRQAKRFEHLAEELKKQGPKISESAVSTPGSSRSEFIEIYNKSNSAINVQANQRRRYGTQAVNYARPVNSKNLEILSKVLYRMTAFQDLQDTLSN